MRSKSINGRAPRANKIHFHWPTSSATANVRLAFIMTESTEMIAFSVTLFQSNIVRPSKTASGTTMAVNERAEPIKPELESPGPPAP